jgi:hypothetical protein
MKMKQIMKRAWEIAKKGQKRFGGKVKEYFAASLKLAWKEAKQTKKVTLEIRHQPSGGKEWIAEIVGRHPRFNFERRFLNPIARDWSSSGKTGTTTFLLEEGKVYEVNEPFAGRYFVTVVAGEIVEIAADEAAQKID